MNAWNLLRLHTEDLQFLVGSKFLKNYLHDPLDLVLMHHQLSRSILTVGDQYLL